MWLHEVEEMSGYISKVEISGYILEAESYDSGQN